MWGKRVKGDHKSTAPAVPMTREEAESCQHLLSTADMFQLVKPQHLKELVQQMKVRVLDKNEVLVEQGSPTDRFFLLESGDIRRSRLDPESGKVQTVEFAIKANSIHSMRVLSKEPAYASIKCVSDACKVYQMMRVDFLQTLNARPDITLAIAEGLAQELRRGSKKFSTPLLEQRQQEVNVPAVSIAAGIESYYRSALNSMLNARLTGVKAELFPNMHIQVPTRIAYITGFKGLRTYFDRAVDPDKFESPTAIRLVTAVSPGILMAPISSLLEASNAGHMNPEPMTTRWMRGIVARAGREIVFGIGLNQMSDYFEERVKPVFPNPMAANAVGSVTAGVVSGYLSHVPHNMSTFKLLEPHRSYMDLYGMFVDRSVPPMIDNLVQAWPSTPRTVTRTLFATFFPRGVVIRTVQIVGSFVILNGTINYLQLREHFKIRRAMGVHT